MKLFALIWDWRPWHLKSTDSLHNRPLNLSVKIILKNHHDFGYIQLNPQRWSDQTSSIPEFGHGWAAVRFFWPAVRMRNHSISFVISWLVNWSPFNLINHLKNSWRFSPLRFRHCWLGEMLRKVWASKNVKLISNCYNSDGYYESRVNSHWK